jgi:hypothetical protein
VLRAVCIIRQNAVHNRRCGHCTLYGHGHALAVAPYEYSARCWDAATPLPLLLLCQCLFIIIL